MRFLIGLALVAGVALPVYARALFKSAAAPGDRLVSLNEVASRYGFGLRAPPGNKIYLTSPAITIEFETDSRNIRINGHEVWMHAPVSRSWGRWCITETDVQKVVFPIINPVALLRSVRAAVVVLDPGHGGVDQGASGRRGLVESRTALDIARRVRAKLVNAGLRAYLTREVDRFIELDERARMAAARQADLFVSIHLNAAQNASSHGIETYVLTCHGYPSTAATSDTRNGARYAANGCDMLNTILGYSLQKNIKDATAAEDRGLRRARFLVLRAAPCAAALIEGGFMSNLNDEKSLMNDVYRDKLADGIARGVLEYVRLVQQAQPPAPAGIRPPRSTSPAARPRPEEQELAAVVADVCGAPVFQGW
ncbi:MAG: N-acetylmuramoyl-L-alanine amidase [Kiritimatiellaeota bacterium]|nr:N-acetylmuramoyl-L-alanine amidase [Kiritimatiellota bacterium]